MRWNWQLPNWPKFTWDQHRLTRAETLFTEGAGMMIGSSRHLDECSRDSLVVEIMSLDALATSAIEGEVLDRDSVQSSIRRQLGLAADRRSLGAAEAGIAEMMVSLYRSLAEPLDHDRLHAWHRMVMNGRRDLEAIGQYRTHHEPMQIVSGAVYAPKVHFEAPPSAKSKGPGSIHAPKSTYKAAANREGAGDISYARQRIGCTCPSPRSAPA